MCQVIPPWSILNPALSSKQGARAHILPPGGADLVRFLALAGLQPYSERRVFHHKEIESADSEPQLGYILCNKSGSSQSAHSVPPPSNVHILKSWQLSN